MSGFANHRRSPAWPWTAVTMFALAFLLGGMSAGIALSEALAGNDHRILIYSLSAVAALLMIAGRFAVRRSHRRAAAAKAGREAPIRSPLGAPTPRRTP